METTRLVDELNINGQLKLLFDGQYFYIDYPKSIYPNQKFLKADVRREWYSWLLAEYLLNEGLPLKKSRRNAASICRKLFTKI